MMKIIALLLIMAAAAAALPSMLVNEVKVVGFVLYDEKNQNHAQRVPVQEDRTIGQVISDEDRFSKLNGLLRDAKGVKEDLDDTKLQITLFAPLNEAFDQFNHTRAYETKDLLKYHMSTEAVLGMGDLHDGLILSTELKEKGLKGGYQIVRINRRENEAYVNLIAHVVSEVVTKNGKILAIDRVLTPPPNMLESIIRVPMVLSDLATALFRTKLDRTFQNQMGLTLLAPDNRAWENMDFEDLFYLFGEEGKRDLIKILKHHTIKMVEYSTRFREEGQVILETMNHDEITVEARRTEQNGQEKHRNNMQNQKYMNCGFPVPCDLMSNVDASEDDGDIDNPEGWEYVLNSDQGNIVFADAPTSNGVIHMISNVLLPEGLNLPSKRTEL